MQDDTNKRVMSDRQQFWKSWRQYCKKAIKQEKSGCKHLDDPKWDKWWCGDCGDYCVKNGCRGPRGRSGNDEK